MPQKTAAAEMMIRRIWLEDPEYRHQKMNGQSRERTKHLCEVCEEWHEGALCEGKTGCGHLAYEGCRFYGMPSWCKACRKQKLTGALHDCADRKGLAAHLVQTLGVHEEFVAQQHAQLAQVHLGHQHVPESPHHLAEPPHIAYGVCARAARGADWKKPLECALCAKLERERKEQERLRREEEEKLERQRIEDSKSPRKRKLEQIDELLESLFENLEEFNAKFPVLGEDAEDEEGEEQVIETATEALKAAKTNIRQLLAAVKKLPTCGADDAVPSRQRKRRRVNA